MTDDQGDKPVTHPMWTVGALLSNMAALQAEDEVETDLVSVVVDALPMCDIHKYDLGQPDVPATYDGKTKRGPWAYMCGECFDAKGVGLGTGLGQRLEVRS